MDYSKLKLNRNTNVPLYEQLLMKLVKGIETGELATGTRLPSERELAKLLRLSRTTIVNAYQELESRGFLRGYVGRGTFVCAAPNSGDAACAWNDKLSTRNNHSNNPALSQLLFNSDNPNIISFAAGAPATDHFPKYEFQRLTSLALEKHGTEVLGLCAPGGLACLRNALSSRMSIRRERILVVSGAQQGLDLITRCLIDPGNYILMDRPGYVGAIQAFRAAGAKIIGWDIARADMDELEELILRYRPKLIYTNPTFHNPTGRVLTLRERQDLLELALRYRVPLIEDDPYRELYLSEPPPPSLYQLDHHNIVIHLSTFSKTLAPGLRLGWIAAPPTIVERLTMIKQQANLFTEGLGQFVIAELLKSNLYEHHLTALRAAHVQSHDLMFQTLNRYLPPQILRTNRVQGGLYFWCRLNNQINSQTLWELAVRKDLLLASGSLFYPDEAGSHELRLCFTSIPREKIKPGIHRLAECVTLAKDWHKYVNQKMH